MTDTEMQRLIDEAQAALDDHFRPRLVVDNKAQLNMSDIVAELRAVEKVRGDTYSSAEVIGLLGRAAAEIERLRDEKAYLMRVVDMDSDAVTEIERLRTALRQVVSSIEDYERINNLAPNPGRKYCWDSVPHAHDVLGDAP